MRIDPPIKRSAWAVAVALTTWAGPAAADDFEAGSYIIPMDLDYQDEGMLRAYGLVYELLRNGVPVRWVITGSAGRRSASFPALPAPGAEAGAGAALGRPWARAR